MCVWFEVDLLKKILMFLLFLRILDLSYLFEVRKLFNSFVIGKRYDLVEVISVI